MTNKENNSDQDWPVTFEQVEEAQLHEMLKLTPAQRLEMAEELFQFALNAKSAKILE